MTKAKTIKVISVDESVKEEVIADIEQISEPAAEPIEVKPKAKRQPRTKKAEILDGPEVNTVSSLDENIVEFKLPIVIEKEPEKVIEKVKCPDCDKMVTPKSLKYSHKYTCIAKKVKELGERPLEQTTVEDDVKEYEPVQITLPTKPIRIESHREIRNRVKQEQMKTIFSNAF
jgi:hypothetical protein